MQAGVVLAGRYRLDRKLGEGGMGVVWAATHVITEQPVALKLLITKEREDDRFVKRFLREARAASAVKHPNVVLVYDVIELDEHTPMMIMEMLHGESLGARLEREGRISVGDFARVVLPVISALGSAHALGIVHRDVKPDNIFLSETPDGMQVKVLDFGIAKLTATQDGGQSGTLTATDALLGTPYYMAPEQVFGEKDVDYRADIWALGVIAYECLSGVRPTEGDNIGQILKIVSTQQIVPFARVAPDAPSEVAEIITRTLSLERAKRPSLSELMAAFSRFTDVRVRSFGEPRAASSQPSLPAAAQSNPQVSIRVGDFAVGEAATVEADPRRVPATLDAGVTRPREGTTPRSAFAIGAAVVIGALAAAGFAMRTRDTPVSATPPPPHATAPAPTHSVTVVASVIASTASAQPAQSASAEPRPTAVQAAHTHAPIVVAVASTTSSAPAPSSTVKKTSPGGVVEQTPY